jgi:predicted metal-dependent phosphoesterase TrpH
MYKLDLHTHSIASPDGALTLDQYRRMLDGGQLDFIAVTDHNRVDFAKQAHKVLGERIIIGEEIMTSQGELIGLFLSKQVPAGLSPEDTIKLIQSQGAIVYVPHPFETIRHAISHHCLNTIASSVQIMEIYNARAFMQDRSVEAIEWAEAHESAIAASSDAHGWAGWGKTYSLVASQPTKSNLVKLLKTPELSTRPVGFLGMLYPKYNRFRNKRYVA